MDKVFNTLNNIINDYDSVIIMGHKDPDLDSLGSSLGLYEIVQSLKKRAYLFLNNNIISNYNSNVSQALNAMNKKIICINEKNYKRISGKVLIIITDLHIKERLEYPDIINKYDVIILDHHIKSKEFIKNAKYYYIDSNLSSMSEFVTFYAKNQNIDLDNVIATILLGGIEIDTNCYNLKTTSDTYKASSILIEMGADTILKQELLKETKEEYVRRANFIRNSFMITSGIAMCIVSGKVTTLELAQSAEELLNFEDIIASFVIGKLDDGKIGVSARSIGEYDVSKIMKKMGGGGHSYNAATQIKNKSIKEIKQEIIELVKE